MEIFPKTIKEMIHHWMPSFPADADVHIHTDTTNFFNIDYNDVIIVGGRPYLIGHNAKEGRFGLDDEVKYWVKRARDLQSGERVIIKLVFYERFIAHVGGLAFECFRSPRKEARILELVKGHPNFMQGHSVEDEQSNIVRIIDYIYGKSLSTLVQNLESDHETYFFEHFPEILDHFLECVEGIRFIHESGEKHGDIRRDHILLDRETTHCRWIDFDYNYRHRENIYGYDLFGLGNVLGFLVGKGDVTLQNLKRENPSVFDYITEADLNIIFGNRVVNLKKVYPYIPEILNRILLHFSKSAQWFYETTGQFITDLREVREIIGGGSNEPPND